MACDTTKIRFVFSFYSVTNDVRHNVNENTSNDTICKCIIYEWKIFPVQRLKVKVCNGSLYRKDEVNEETGQQR